jgi:hypothetical protein
MDWSLVVFAFALLGTIFVTFLGRRDSSQIQSSSLAEHKLNKWLVGLSAAATANSGFVVTAAVGLGYSFGLRWLLLPLSWLLGDVVFWVLFPRRFLRGDGSWAVTGSCAVTDRHDPMTKGPPYPCIAAWCCKWPYNRFAEIWHRANDYSAM